MDSTQVKMENLGPLNLKKLVVGTKLETPIYYMYKNDLVMLCEDIVVTGTVMGTFLTVKTTHGDLYVDKNKYPELIKIDTDKKNFKSADDEVYFRDLEAVAAVYDDTLKKVKRLYDYAKQTSEVDLFLTQEIVDAIKTLLQEHRGDAIFICISQQRDVNNYLYTHILDVGIMNGLMGMWINLDEENREKLISVGILHDIGKTQIPDEILNKPGKYTQEEYDLVKRHSLLSYDLVKKAGIKDLNILHGIRSHHERMIGTGYPDGLDGSSIPFFGRVTAICDVYDAMITTRCYKEAVSPFAVLSEFTKERYSDFDIKYVNLFLETAGSLLVGRDVVLSDGRIATVQCTRPDAYAYPIVNIDGEIIITNSNLYCKEMYEPDIDIF